MLDSNHGWLVIIKSIEIKIQIVYNTKRYNIYWQGSAEIQMPQLQLDSLFSQFNHVLLFIYLHQWILGYCIFHEFIYYTKAPRIGAFLWIVAPRGTHALFMRVPHTIQVGSTWNSRTVQAGPTWDPRAIQAGPTWDPRAIQTGPTWGHGSIKWAFLS